MTQHVKDENH